MSPAPPPASPSPGPISGEPDSMISYSAERERDVDRRYYAQCFPPWRCQEDFAAIGQHHAKEKEPTVIIIARRPKRVFDMLRRPCGRSKFAPIECINEDVISASECRRGEAAIVSIRTTAETTTRKFSSSQSRRSPGRCPSVAKTASHKANACCRRLFRYRLGSVGCRRIDSARCEHTGIRIRTFTGCGKRKIFLSTAANSPSKKSVY